MKTRTSKILLAVVLTASLLFAFATWYKSTYSMEIAESREINFPGLQSSLFIATQGSDYKDALLEKVIDHFKSKKVHIKVADISQLKRLDESKWDAICIMHTWEIGKAPKDVVKYMDQKPPLQKTIIFNTAGDGESHLPNVDAISGASELTNIPTISKQIINRIEVILQANHSKNRNLSFEN